MTPSTAHELLAIAASTPFEVVSITPDDAAPDGSVRAVLSLAEDDVEHAGLALLFALAALSFAEARPAGNSGMHFEDDDQWSLDDLVEYLRFRRGRLCLDTDYVRGRLMKTTLELAPDGALTVQVVNRGQTARRWLALLQGRKPLAVVADHPEDGPFYAPSGERLDIPDDWRAVHPPHHWKAGRSAMLLARSWGGAGGFPESVVTALDRHERLRDLTLAQGLVEHEVPTPGRGKASQTDLVVFARDPLGNDVRIAVEGKVDEGFAEPVGVWLRAGTSPNSPANRRRRLDDMLLDLGIDPAAEGVELLGYQLVHRAWSALRVATDSGARRAVCLVHSFVPPSAPGSGWRDFERLASLLDPEGPPIVPGVPWRAQVLDGVEYWLLWVADSGGVPG